MTRPCPTVLLSLLCAPLLVGNAAGDGKPQEPLPGVKTQLVISVDEYDPFTPSKGVIKCVVINNSGAPVEVSIGYDGKENRLMAQALRPLTLYTNQEGKDERKRIKVQPGKEQVVFELSLDDILIQRGKGEPGKLKEWKWNWDARPEPPPSPIHRWRKPGFVEKATFWVEVVVNDKKLSSGMTVLKVKPSVPESK